MKDCIFCKIVRGELSSHKIYEDEFSLAFLDIYPFTEGHTMVIPKQHYQTIQEMPAELVGKIFETVSIVTGKVEHAMGAVATTIGINNGRGAGQVVPHLHVHIVPRYENDGGGNLHSIVQKPTQNSLETVKKKILNQF
ncbi:HIT family protein [Candidatus Acetothermia bacterium]|nr:HIT family protein [Candidatus Acetothermia bacterium]